MSMLRFDRAMADSLCELCRQPFAAHFQPPDDADPNLAANWCPAVGREGYTSRVFKKETPKPCER